MESVTLHSLGGGLSSPSALLVVYVVAMENAGLSSWFHSGKAALFITSDLYYPTPLQYKPLLSKHRNDLYMCC